MRKKVLVVGDSFMVPDPMYPGQHWSEMLPQYEIVMNAQSGASNGIIAERFYQGLKQNPDAAVLGFSFPTRIEFRYNDKWISGGDTHHITKEQQLASDLYQVHTDFEMRQIKETSIARGMMSMLQARNVPFAWTLNGLFDNLAQIPFPSDPWVNFILGDYAHCRTPTNLATYQGFTMTPGFHTDDPEWQKRFANEVQEILQKSFDFS
jgi:hypothetical protein